jgi:pyruvate formate lyase activating enzyme
VGRAVLCELCPRGCILADGERSFCRVRENKGGKLLTVAYENPAAVHIDPIEKKPLFHFLPKTYVLSVATAGCNLRCKFCQNWQISQKSPYETTNFSLSPKAVVKAALLNKCSSIGYTYTEPTIFFEYMLAIAKLAREKAVMNICHTNAFIREKPLAEVADYLDAVNVDLKGFEDEYYRSMTQAWLKPVLENLVRLKKAGVHLEITNLVVPTKNDETKSVSKMCRWIKENLGTETPLHFARFYPHYKLLNLPPTSVSILEALRNTAIAEGLKYVYIGNLPGHHGSHTYCPNCSKLLIRRSGFDVGEYNLKGGRCKFCNQKIAGVWKTNDV